MICKALDKIRDRQVAKLIRVGHIRVTHVSCWSDGQKIQKNKHNLGKIIFQIPYAHDYSLVMGSWVKRQSITTKNQTISVTSRSENAFLRPTCQNVASSPSSTNEAQ